MKCTTEPVDDILPFAPEYLQPASTPRDVFISIQPRHAINIVNGTKTVEFRRRFPNDERVLGATVWIYSSSPVKAVIGVARVEEVDRLPVRKLWATYRACGGIDQNTFIAYFSGAEDGYAIRLGGVIELDDEVSAASLRQVGFHVPQSYRYVTDDVYPLLRDAHGETSSRYQCRDQA